MIKTLKLLLFFCLFEFSASGQITITSGAHIVVNGAAQLVINNSSIVNNGTFSAGNGTVSLTGTIASTIASTGSPLQFYNLLMNQADGVKLLNSIAVAKELVFTQGVIDLNGFNIDLGTNGNLIGENAASFITTTSMGFVTRTAQLNAPIAANPGNLGLEITSAANMGTTLIKRGHQQQVSATGYSIHRFYDVLPSNNRSLNATVNFHYLEGELAGINEAELKAWSSAANGWNVLASNTTNTADNYVIQPGIQTFSRLTLASAVNKPLAAINNAMPVTVYPNPTKAPLTIRFLSMANTHTLLTIVDAKGAQVFSQSIAAEAGLNQVKCDISFLARGTYFIQLSGVTHSTIKIIKQ